MATHEISAQPRTVTGKKVRALRRQGLVPAVLYGPGVSGTHTLSLNAREIERVYAQVGKSAMVQLRVQGQTDRAVIIHHVQHDHLHRNLIHVDFLAPDMRAELTVAVPLAVIGEAPAVRDEGGILVQVVGELPVSALPDQLPAVLTVDAAALTDIGAHLTASDVALPEGVHLAAPADETVVMIDRRPVEEEPVVEAAEEAAEEATEEPVEEATTASAEDETPEPAE